MKFESHLNSNYSRDISGNELGKYLGGFMRFCPGLGGVVFAQEEMSVGIGQDHSGWGGTNRDWSGTEELNR